MKKKFMRRLHTDDLMNEFLVHALGYEKCRTTTKIVNKLVDAEMQLETMGPDSTLSSNAYRDPKFKTDSDRKQLRKRIYEELISNERLSDDEKIKLGRGGALPKGGTIRRDKNAYLIIGPPASGKSSIACKLADSKKAIILDCDYAKRKFPEFKRGFGASLVHEESDMVVFDPNGKKEYSVFEYCLAANSNIVIPKIGTNKQELEELRDSLTHREYKVHLILVSLDRVKATQRAIERFLNTKRYVPLSLIFDEYSNEAILTYYRLKNSKKWSSVGKLNTDTPKGSKPIIIESINNSPVKIFR